MNAPLAAAATTAALLLATGCGAGDDSAAERPDAETTSASATPTPAKTPSTTPTASAKQICAVTFDDRSSSFWGLVLFSQLPSSEQSSPSDRSAIADAALKVKRVAAGAPTDLKTQLEFVADEVGGLVGTTKPSSTFEPRDIRGATNVIGDICTGRS